MRSRMIGTLTTAVAAMAMLAMGAGALRAQQSNDDGRMRTPSDNDDGSRGRSIVPGERILHTGQGGTYIVLRDNTVWEVYLPDRTSTVGWREGDFLIVKKAPVGHGNYTYELINGRTEETAVVRFEGRSG
ncbi:MAG TPA: hypothetical protein VFK39_15850 [Gemmatimonadaceae bacterium]|nr:hypothetical protein [Gemmatimonadaceae bacterium]